MRQVIAPWFLSIGLCVGLGAASSAAVAQQLWIEQGTNNARLFFGDYANNLKETSPGRLDSLQRPQARAVAIDARDVLSLKKLRTRDGFDLGTRVGQAQTIVVQETNYPMIESKEGDRVVRTAWIPAARYVYDLSAQEVALALDIFPTVRAGVFKVVFSGRPLAGATVQVVSSSGWLREVEADAAGLIRVSFPWKDTYVLKAQYTDDRPGQRPGLNGPEPYDIAKFTTSTTVETSVGDAPPLPRPVAAIPSR